MRNDVTSDQLAIVKDMQKGKDKRNFVSVDFFAFVFAN